MRTSIVAVVAAAALGVSAFGFSQPRVDRERAKLSYKAGYEQFRAERFAEAATFFQQAIDVDPEYDLAYYMLGRADMAQKKYTEAIGAFAKCRDIYRAQAGRQFSNAQEAQRYRRDRITEIDEMIRQVSSGPQTAQAQDQLRQLQEQKRQIQDVISRGNNLTIDSTVPAWVSLSLGSAYFRAQKLPDAEREYKAALDVDPKAGEAHNNLAVVYLLTGRYDDAQKSITQAKKVGFRVNPQLEQDIKDKKGGV
jgi:tetratricopeptide (TPR) repeat protein